MYGHRPVATAKDVYARAHEVQLSFLAASLAYYMLVSLFPLGLLGFVLASTVGGEAFADNIIEAASAFLSPTGTELLNQALRTGAGRGGATAIGVVLLVWGGLRVFRGLDVAFTLAYGRDHPGSLVEQFADALVALVGIVVAVGSLVAANWLLAAAGITLTGLGGTVLLILPLFVAFYPFYYLFPDVELSYRDPIPGAAFAAVGWTVLGATFTLYASNAASVDLYGAVGGILLLVTWFYVAGAILLTGAVINAVLAGVESLDVARTARAVAEGDVGDRQRQKAAARKLTTMSDDVGTPSEHGESASNAAADESTAGDPAAVGTGSRAAEPRDGAEVERLREELAELRDEVDEKSVPKDDLESDLRRYVRARVRRGHARGWGPYLVLLYGTAMTIGAFVYLDDLLAVVAMFVIWLSTLGLYALMLLVGTAASALSLPGKAIDRVRDVRR